jgi:NAD(P)-dependent dehydrogenase (short-subunit alcohol dehydrogenase family)/acyl carrier protein
MRFDPKPTTATETVPSPAPAATSPPAWIAQALETVQTGLKSIQALQQQTAAAHEKFLETQAEASRTLQAMLASTRGLATGDRSAPLPLPTQPPAAPAAEPALHPTPASPPNVMSPVPLPSAPVVHEPPATSSQPAPPEQPMTRKEGADSTVAPHLLEVVSDLTGYPVEMLDLTMDIEGDLGIDSIKRVEILSTLEETMPHLPTVSADQMGQLKTLGDIIQFLSSGQLYPQPEQGEPHSKPAPTLDEVQPTPPAEPRQLERRAPVVQALPFQPGPALTLDLEGIIVVISPPSPLGETLEATLTQAFRRPVTRYTWPEAAQALESFDQARAIRGLVLVAERHSTADVRNLHGADAYLKTAFEWAKLAEVGLNPNSNPDLKDGPQHPAKFLATVSFLDGAFGFSGRDLASPLSGALAGLVKTADLEWPQTLCRAFDLDSAWQDWQAAAQRICAELMTPPTEGGIEVGIDSKLPRETRNLLALEPLAHADKAPLDLSLGEQDVVLVTGGARGITAQAVKALAAHCPARFVLLGRSPEPFKEPAWLNGVTEAAAMKSAIAENEIGAEGTPLTPRNLESCYRRYIHNREIRDSLDHLEQQGSRIIYRSLNVRDREAMEALGKWIATTQGPVRAVVHAAGILHDRSIADKSLDQFQAVFETKVHGLFNLLAAVDPAQLRYLVLFSSVSARMGNAGQADYAMANEVLNKLAQMLALRYPQARVKSINWGPWDGGMVTDSLKRAFARRGVTLIPLEAGAAQLLAEMGAGNPPGPVEIVVGSGLFQAQERPPHSPALEMVHPSPAAGPAAQEAMETVFSETIDLEQFPILHDHRLDGIPVVPFALMAEWFAHGALHGHPGLSLVGWDDMRLMAGIRLEKHAAQVQVRAGRASRENGFFSVPVELRKSGAQSSGLIHSRARVLLAERPLIPGELSARIPQANGHYRRSVGEVYRDVLFHGRNLQGIQEIENFSAEGMSARVAAAPRPGEWVRQPLRSRWLADPLVLDSAFQMASLWCFEQSGAVSLPSYAARYRQYCRRFPRDPVTIHLRVDQVKAHKITADIAFMDQEENLLAVMEGFEAVMDVSLIKAFKPQNAA